jgi:nondiscriminating aspartyl-tRNA synthetase
MEHEYLTGAAEKETWEIRKILSEGQEGQPIKVNGAIHTIRDMGTITFIVLRKRGGLLQCVSDASDETQVTITGLESDNTDAESALSKDDVNEASLTLKSLKEASCIEAEGTLSKNEKAPGGIELKLTSIRILSEPAQPLPIPIAKWKMNTNIDTNLNLRPISLRNIRERAKFKIQEGVCRGFRDFLISQEFTEIHTPKLCSKGAEGGANMFKLDYFHRPAVLAQSPQFYKQMMVGVFDRVFEVGPVFRAEKHNTKRHLNEYTSLDFEMGYIDSFVDIMAMETGVLQNILTLLKNEYAKELSILNITLTSADRIPCVRFDEAKRNVSEKYNRPIRNPFDLEPEEEVLISRYYKEEIDADFVFVTHYPSKKRPVYAMDDPADPTYTLSFDCLLGGMEITTGGQRIHDYQMQVDKIARRGMTTEGLEHYLMAFKHGMPPHGGLGLGLERLTMKLIGEDNVREATLFPRDLSRLEP